MRNNWFLFIDLDGGSPCNFSSDPLIFHGHLFSQFSSFVDNSLNHSRNLLVPGSAALHECFNCMSKFAGPFFLWLGSNNSLRVKIAGDIKSSSHIKYIMSSRHFFRGFRFGSGLNGPVTFSKTMKSIFRRLFREAEHLQSLPLLSLGAALVPVPVPPYNNSSSNALAVPLETTTVQMHAHGCMEQIPCEVERHGCSGLSFPDLNLTRQAIEPRTGIEFPIILDNILPGGNNYRFNSEVLVGTGAKSMKIIKIKSLKVYAFGFYIHPNSLCGTLGSKYASMPLTELNQCRDFYQDLLREDIGMTLRLVVNYNGMKINSVKDAFETSLRDRLLKTNPNTDYNCLATFGSYFTNDITLRSGTIIDFRRTADGRLITEIGGNQIGSVHSKELCRAFFDMYVGDSPVSEQTKEEIGRNIATMMRRC